MALSKIKIKQIHNDISDALKAVAEKHDLNLVKSTISYADDYFKLNCTFGDRTELGDANPIYRKTMESRGYKFGLSTNDIGAKFATRQGEIEVVGMRGDRIVGKAPDGRDFLYDPTVVASLLAKRQPVKEA